MLRPHQIGFAVAALCAAGAFPLRGQGVPYDQTYLRAGHNWAFRSAFPAVDHVFNAFDYGHSILSETLLTRLEVAGAELDGPRFEFVTRHLLVHPPSVPLEVRAISPTFSRLVPEIDAIFEWAHMLHRQVYDIWADPQIPESRKDAEVAKVVRYYGSRPDLALSSSPKSMELMEGQPYSGAFRRLAPRYNGLIWSYHWFQMAVYEVLLEQQGAVAARGGMTALLGRFRSSLACSPPNLPAAMPLSFQIAPQFSRRYPEAAAIFDNLHSLHDVVSDILASPMVSGAGKRTALLAAAARYRDDSTGVISGVEWLAMSRSMEWEAPKC